MIPRGDHTLITVLAHVATLLLALAGAGLIAWWRAREEVRNSFAQHDREARDILERARLSLATAQEAIAESAERAARERARVEQAERRAKVREEQHEQPRAWSARDYKRHLERGGRRDRSFEQTLTKPAPGEVNGRAE
jgi:hypothetical protein